MKIKIPVLLISAFALCLTSCKDKKDKETKKEPEMKEHKLKEENVSYQLDDSSTRNNFVVYDESIEGKRPGVLVIHEWWGLNDYAKMRARELAKLGYIAMAVDMYGDGKMGPNPDEAGKLAGPFYAKPDLAKPILEAAINKLESYQQTDADRLGAIGYCFGGAQVINAAKMGYEFKGVVSFHGNLTVMPPNKDLLKSEILVCHGADDSFVPMTELEQFKKQMDSVGAKYEVKVYPGATHAFTNPQATELGEKFKIPIKYNAAADTASWNDMKVFFNRVFTNIHD